MCWLRNFQLFSVKQERKDCLWWSYLKGGVHPGKEHWLIDWYSPLIRVDLRYLLFRKRMRKNGCIHFCGDSGRRHPRRGVFIFLTEAGIVVWSQSRWISRCPRRNLLLLISRSFLLKNSWRRMAHWSSSSFCIFRRMNRRSGLRNWSVRRRQDGGWQRPTGSILNSIRVIFRCMIICWNRRIWHGHRGMWSRQWTANMQHWKWWQWLQRWWRNGFVKWIVSNSRKKRQRKILMCLWIFRRQWELLFWMAWMWAFRWRRKRTKSGLYSCRMS